MSLISNIMILSAIFLSLDIGLHDPEALGLAGTGNVSRSRRQNRHFRASTRVNVRHSGKVRDWTSHYVCFMCVQSGLCVIENNFFEMSFVCILTM